MFSSWSGSILLISLMCLLITDCAPSRPDLVIQHISYSVVPIDSSIADSVGLFTATIGNIGTADCAESFFIVWGDSETGEYSGANRVNYFGNGIIVAGGSIVEDLGAIWLWLHPPGTKMIFRIQTDGTPFSQHQDPPQKIDELNYQNNTYVFVIPNR